MNNFHLSKTNLKGVFAVFAVVVLLSILPSGPKPPAARLYAGFGRDPALATCIHQCNNDAECINRCN
jgi:hypothetical protein